MRSRIAIDPIALTATPPTRANFQDNCGASVRQKERVLDQKEASQSAQSEWSTCRPPHMDQTGGVKLDEVNYGYARILTADYLLSHEHYPPSHRDARH
jgi:hypothetical protein